MQTAFQAITQIIHAVGRDDFAAVAARALCDLTCFELATIVVHRRKTAPSLLFDNFALMDARLGLQNYLSITHRLNPVLRGSGGNAGAVRASDYKATPLSDQRTAPYFNRTAQEELGFLTVGWPAGMEELGLYFEAMDGVVEFCVYRERSRKPAANETLSALNLLREPIAAAFSRHEAFTRSSVPASMLSPREAQVAELMLAGCSSEAIAMRLHISRHTVKDHRKQIFRRLGISSLAEFFALSQRASNPPLWRDVLPVQEAVH